MTTHKKLLLAFLTLWGLQGCFSTSNHYYILSLAPQPTKVYANQNRAIGVKKVTVPAYLYKREIAVATTSRQIILMSDALWGEDLDIGLTNRLISFLQKKFQQPNIYAYPWGIGREPTVKVKVDVTRFIAHGDKVYLDANWEVENVETKTRTAKLFHTSVPTKADVESIVSAMDKAFSQLEETIATGIKSN